MLLGRESGGVGDSEGKGGDEGVSTRKWFVEYYYEGVLRFVTE